MNQRELGSVKEKLAGGELEKRGYQILTYNFRCRMGEIDIVAKHREYLVFVEVKYRRDDRCGDPAEAVTRAKQRTISKVSDYYKMKMGYEWDCATRYDVVAITGSKVRIIEDAFWYQK